MALIKCNECGKEISDEARKCPNCGAKTETAKLRNKKIRLYSIISISIILIIGGLILAKVLLNNTIPVEKNKKKAILLLQKYKNDEIDTEKLCDELDQLHDDVEALYNKETDFSKKIRLSSLQITLSSIEWEIHSKYLYMNSHQGTSDSKINEYINEIKDL